MTANPTGPHTLRYGIEHSKNLMTVRLARDLGMPLVAEYAKRFGVYDDMLPVLSMSLGAGETTVLRMTAAYSMLANGGRRIRPTLIDRIQDRWGATIYRHDERMCKDCPPESWTSQDEPRLVDKRERVIDPMSAYQMVSIMDGRDPARHGGIAGGLDTRSVAPGAPRLAARPARPTTRRTCGSSAFRRNLAVGVYLGYDKPRSLGTSATAGQYAAPIFGAFMKEALAGKPNLTFRVPPGIKFIRVNAASGQRDFGVAGAFSNRSSRTPRRRRATASAPRLPVRRVGGGGSRRDHRRALLTAGLPELILRRIRTRPLSSQTGLHPVRASAMPGRLLFRDEGLSHARRNRSDGRGHPAVSRAAEEASLTGIKSAKAPERTERQGRASGFLERFDQCPEDHA